MKSKYTALIVGFGVVGKNLYADLWRLHPDIYDKYLPKDNCKREDIKYDIAFICVDTPTHIDDSKTGARTLSLKQVHNAIYENDAEIYVIKSTLPVGSIEKLSHIYEGKRIVYSPEYYGDTQHNCYTRFNFTILGGKKEDCIAVQQILQECYDASHQFKIVDSDVAELVKLMENAYLATIVSFCTQMYEVCKANDICYEDLRELFILDPRVNPSHTYVYRDHPYWDSHCLNKDVLYLANWADATFLQDVIKFNDEQRRKYGG